MSEVKENTQGNENSLEVINEDLMMERGKFKANGYTFTVQPIFLREEDEYFSDLKISPIPPSIAQGEMPTDKDLGRWAIALFSEKANGGQPYKKMGKVRRFFVWLFHHNDYHYYADCKNIAPYVKWVEKKVKYKGRKVRFFDLERKFSLSKAEIEKLFIYLHQLSGF